MRRSLAVSCAASLFLAVVGCASPEDAAPEESGEGQAVSVGGSALNVDLSVNKDEPSPWPSGCQPFTHLSMSKDGRGMRAQLEERLPASATCLRVVEADAREYKLVELPPSCGTRSYTATSGADKLKIVDNRFRTCLDLVPQPKLIVIEERSGKTATLYPPKIKP